MPMTTDSRARRMEAAREATARAHATTGWRVHGH